MQGAKSLTRMLEMGDKEIGRNQRILNNLALHNGLPNLLGKKCLGFDPFCDLSFRFQ